MQVSQRLTDFVASEEGVVTKAYRDPVGILTIGVGHTTAAGGLVVKAGMTITRQQAFELLRTDLAKFAKRCETAMPGAVGYGLEGSTSFDFNTGAIHKASWVKYWGLDVKEARRRFKLWNKAGGKVLPGLVSRRAREADIIFQNKWPEAIAAAKPTSVSEAADYHDQLIKLGYVKPDQGFAGISLAVEAFQLKNDLVVDGVVGPATRATLQRKLAEKKANKAALFLGSSGTAGTTAVDAIDMTSGALIGLGLLVAIIAAGWMWRNRGRLFGIRAKITSGEI